MKNNFASGQENSHVLHTEYFMNQSTSNFWSESKQATFIFVFPCFSLENTEIEKQSRRCRQDERER